MEESETKTKAALEAELDAKLKEFMPLLKPGQVQIMGRRGRSFMSNMKHYYKNKPYGRNLTRTLVDVVRQVQDKMNEITLLDEQIAACERADNDKFERAMEEARRRKTMAARAAKREKILRGGDAQVEKIIAQERVRQRRLERARQIRMDVERRFARKE